jgi:hypothetical protein
MSNAVLPTEGTIAASRAAKTLNKDDLPAFGGPKMAVSMIKT